MSGITPVSAHLVPQMPQASTRQAYKLSNGKVVYSNNEPTIRDEFNIEHKKNGLVERLYNGAKNITGLGTGSKKAEQAVKKAEAGEISEDDARKTIDKYRKSQVNSAQAFGDIMSVGASGMTFFGLNKWGKWASATTNVNTPFVNTLKKELEEFTQAAAESLSKAKTPNEIKNAKAIKKAADKLSSFVNKIINTLKSDKKMLGIAIGSAVLAGAVTKWFVMKLNRVGATEFDVSKKDYNKALMPQDKVAYKAEKKAKNKEKRKANFRNFVSGAINGAMMPLGLLGGLVAAPIYVIGNSLNRYFVGNHEEKNKSVKGYFDNLGNDALLHTATAAAIAIPMYKKANWTKTFNKNIKEVVAQLEKANLQNPEFSDKTAYAELRDALLGSDDIQRIVNSSDSIEKQAQALIDENIFAAKFKQIDQSDALGKTLKQACPATRTLEGAQAYIDNALGKGYEVKKLLGVGTVAETYIAKGSDGKEVCLKVLKDGIDADKIVRDKEKFINLVKNMADKTDEQKQYLIRNIEDLAEGISKEVNLQSEMDAAIRIAKTTQVANVVKPISVKNGVYIMEKANGISLESFLNLNSLYIKKEALEKAGLDVTDIVKEIEFIKSRTPDFADIKFDKKDADYLLKEYQKVFIEQFHKVEKGGKTIHGDIHPGNIFIDPQVLRNRKGKLFTLIDTGNVIDMNVEQSLRALNMTNFVKKGNVKDITEFVLEGAKLPEGMDKAKAKEIIEKELRTIFFDTNTRLNGSMTEEKVLGLADNIMQKYDIIPGSSQLNLTKTKTSARNSLTDLKSAIAKMDMLEIMEASEKGTANATGKGLEKFVTNTAKNKAYDASVARQEKLNLKQLTKDQIRIQKNNPNNLPNNDKDYITYKLKQLMLNVEDFV